jgi:hypothetical protein
MPVFRIGKNGEEGAFKDGAGIIFLGWAGGGHLRGQAAAFLNGNYRRIVHVSRDPLAGR